MFKTNFAKPAKNVIFRIGLVKNAQIVILINKKKNHYYIIFFNISILRKCLKNHYIK